VIRGHARQGAARTHRRRLRLDQNHGSLLPPARIGGALPELYVRVYDSAGDCVVSTRGDAARNTIPELIRIPIDRDVASKHGLI